MPHRSESDHQRFDRLYATHLPLILGYAIRRCPEPGDAADIAAEVFLVAWRRLSEIPDGEERLWLFGVARKVLANQVRGRLRRHRLSDKLRGELAAGIKTAPAADTAIAKTIDEDVANALNTLPTADRELLKLTVWDGLTPTEVAALEGIPAATVRSRLLRARAKLRDALLAADVIEPVAAGMQRGPTAGHVTGGAPSTTSEPEARS